MPHYRVYELGDDDKIVMGTSIDVPDDDSATQQAVRLVGERGVEVWQEQRRVLTIKTRN